MKYLEINNLAMMNIETGENKNYPNDLIKEKEVILYDPLDSWMSKLPASLRNVPLIHLAIPGSHDTMTYTINRHDDIAPDGPPFVRNINRICPVFTKYVVFNWSITQHEDVTQQLNGGIRYLDLRVSTKPGSDGIYFVHGLYGSEITMPLQEIMNWLSSHGEEVVILDFQHFYLFSETDHQRLIALISQIFQGRLCPIYSELNCVTLEWLAMRKFQVIVIYRNDIAVNYTYLWPSKTWPTPWPDTVNINFLLQFLNRKLYSRLPNIGFVSQCLLTPDTLYVLQHPCDNLQNSLGISCQKAVIPWLQTKQSGPKGLNVAITDFISNGDFLFSKTVIQCNTKFLEN